MTRRLRALALAAMIAPLPAAAEEAPGPSPAAVSPGHPSRLLSVGDRCPTFSWAQVAGAERYELVVYRVREGGEEAPVALRQMIDGRAGSWTPTLGRCLERGGRYAWSLRARRGAAASPWSPAALFRIAEGPTASDLEEALALLRDGAGGDRDGRGKSAPSAGERLPTGAAAAGSGAGASGAQPPRRRGPVPRGDLPLGLSIEGRIEADAFSGDGASLANVQAAGLSCPGCVGAGEIADGAVTAGKIGEACAAGQVLMRGAAGWQCADLAPPACAPGDELTCYTGPAGTRGVGLCQGGLRQCAGDSTWGLCAGEVVPAAELCDGLDNSCDGAVDVGDPAALCPPTAHVTATACDAAACAVTGCEPSWADADGDYANGCEAPAEGHCLDGGAPRPIAGPGAGELVIRELMADPASPLGDSGGEWFEVAVHAAVDLNGLGLGTTPGTVSDSIDDADCRPAQAGDVLLFARSADPAANGGLTPDRLFGFSLVNGGGELHLAWDGELVDAVSWGAGDITAGRARNLPPGAEDATANDDPAAWCDTPAEPALLYSEANYGTPGAANVDCP